MPGLLLPDHRCRITVVYLPATSGHFTLLLPDRGMIRLNAGACEVLYRSTTFGTPLSSFPYSPVVIPAVFKRESSFVTGE